jgi:hypothetical protein
VSVSDLLLSLHHARQVKDRHPAKRDSGTTTIRLTISRSLVVNGKITQESTGEVRLFCPVNFSGYTLFRLLSLSGAHQYWLHMNGKISVGPSPIRFILDQLPGGWRTAIPVLQHVAKQDGESDEAKVLNAWEETTSVHGKKTTGEQIAEAAGMTPSHMLGVIIEAAHLQTVNVAKLVKAIKLGEVMERGVKEALKPAGFKDRERILQSAGLYPAPAGTTITVEATAQAGAQVSQSLAAVDGLDEFERDTLDATEFLRSVDQPEEATKVLESPASFTDSTAKFVDATFSTTREEVLVEPRAPVPAEPEPVVP